MAGGAARGGAAGGGGPREGALTVRDIRLDGHPVWEGERDGQEGVLSIRGPSGEVDAGFACAAEPPEEEPSWIVGWEPLLDAREDLVHHMDIFLCHRSVTEHWNLDDKYVCATDAFMVNHLEVVRPGRSPGGVGASVVQAVRDAKRGKRTERQLSGCSKLALAYDKGAGRYMLPEGFGYEVGPGTASDHRFVLQNHYLVPPQWGNRGARDSSGMRLFLTRERPQHVVSGFSMNDFGLRIPPEQPEFHYKFEEGAGVLLRSPLANDLNLAGGGGVRFVAVHLHTHNMARRVWIDHMRDGVKIGEVARNDEYAGYGPDQTFFDVLDPTAPLFQIGDGLVLNCVYNSTGVPKPTPYGVSHGTEMCAAFLVYADHNTSAVPRFGNMPSIQTKPRRSDFFLP